MASMCCRQRVLQLDGIEELLPDDDSDYVGLAFHLYGIYAISVDGTYKRVSQSCWFRTVSAASDGANSIFAFHQKSVYSLSYYALDCSEPEVLRDSNLDVRVAIRMPADEDKLYLIHHEGMSTLNYSTGTITEMESDVWSWAGILTAAYNPGDPSNAYVFHKTGLYKVNLFEATYERVGELKWTVAAAAVYSRRLEAILLFFGRGYTAGCCVVNLDGTVSKTYTKFKHLDQAVAAVETRNPDQVFVIYRCGLFLVNVNDGVHFKLSKEPWHYMSAFTPLGEHGFISCKLVPEP